MALGLGAGSVNNEVEEQPEDALMSNVPFFAPKLELNPVFRQKGE